MATTSMIEVVVDNGYMDELYEDNQLKSLEETIDKISEDLTLDVFGESQ